MFHRRFFKHFQSRLARKPYIRNDYIWISSADKICSIYSISCASCYLQIKRIPWNGQLQFFENQFFILN